MYQHASMNRTFRLLWSETLNNWVPVAEIARGRRKRGGRRAAATLATLLGIAGLQAHADGPAPTPNEVPRGGTVVTGGATITSPATAVLNVDQTTQRAVIDWHTFNVGSDAQVNFNQPGRESATLNRVLDANPSQIFGRIAAPGQIFLTNPSGVYFGKTAAVDVGGLTATTHSIDNAEFMTGDITLHRNGATGRVDNAGELNAALGGYIALLAPEVRNSGVIVARLGTVVMAAGESITLNFDDNHLTGITAQPSTIAALIENRAAVLAPGGLIILSAQAADTLQGGVVRNLGTLEATGLATHDGHIVLEATSSVDNSGTIRVDAGIDGSAAGSVIIDAPLIVNSGVISAAATIVSEDAAVLASVAGGNITLTGSTIEQTAAGVLDVSGVAGGSVQLAALQDIAVAGRIIAIAIESEVEAVDTGAIVPTDTHGGSINITAAHAVTFHNALLDVSGGSGGGQIFAQGGSGPEPTNPPADAPTVALLGATQLRSSSRRGQGGTIALTADRVGVFGSTSIEASGATGGGVVLVGGGFQGGDTSIANARRTHVGRDAVIRAEGGESGNGGQVIVWSNEFTHFAGSISVRGGDTAGDGGFVEVSGKDSLAFHGFVDASAADGKAGSLLLDPRDITVQIGGGSAAGDVDDFTKTPASDLTIDPSAITAITNLGTNVYLQANNDIILNSSILTFNNGGSGGALTFQAGRSIVINAGIISDDANISFVLNDISAQDPDRIAGAAAFLNAGLIDAGSADVSIILDTKGDSGVIGVGQVTANNFTITHNGPTSGAVTGRIDLGEITIDNNLTIFADSARNVVNTIGSVIVRGNTSIDVGAGDVTINRATTDFNVIGVSAHDVTLNDTNSMRFATSVISGFLTSATRGPVASTGALMVTGPASFTSANGGFGFGDPYIDLTNAANDFQGGVSLSVASTGATGTGGYATIRDLNGINITSSATATSLLVNSGGAVNVTTATSGSAMTINAAGAVDLGTTTVGTNLTISTTGAITDSGTLTVANQTILAAGAANPISLDTPANNFFRIQVNSGSNVTLVDSSAIEFGTAASTMAGNLNVTAGGTISQYDYNNNTAPIGVGGSATFTVTAANSDLLLGPAIGNYNVGYAGAANSITGTVTLAQTNPGTYRDVLIRNTSAGAAVVAGLGAGLRDVLFYYDNASTVAVPGMTLSGNLVVDAQNGGITQSGAIVVDTSVSAGFSTFRAAAASDVTLDDTGNDFYRVTVRNGRDVILVDSDAIELYGNGYQFLVQHDLAVTAGGNITDGSNSDPSRYIAVAGGTATLDSGAGDITLDNAYNRWNIVKIPAANNVVLNPDSSVIFGASTIGGSLSMDSRVGGSVTQNAAVTTVGTTTFVDFNAGITLANANNAFGNLAISNSLTGAVTIVLRENHAITQASAWNTANAVTLTTSDDQAITLDQANIFGNLTLTQINNGAGSAGAVHVRETGDILGMTQSGAWTLHGTTRLDSGTHSINLNDAANVFGPLQVSGATGASQMVTLYAQDTASTDAITDVGSAGEWNTGTGVVRLVAYDISGTAGAGAINLANIGNVLGDLYIKGADVTITENGSITDGISTVWNPGGDTGWVTTGATHLIVANPAGKSITLDSITNQLGALGVSTTGGGILTSVLITDNTDLTQASAWDIGAAPITLDARSHLIDLSASGNVLGAIAVTTLNGAPASLSIKEDDVITQASAWSLAGVAVTLEAENFKSIALTNSANVMGALTVTGGAVSITENDAITQSGAWATASTTTLNPTDNAVTLTHADNVLGDLAFGGTPTTVSIREDDSITQAAAWVQAATVFTLNAGIHDVVLAQAGNQLGNLTIAALNATIVENHLISDGDDAWVVSGTTALTAGTNAIVLDASSDFGTVQINSAASASLADVNAIEFATSSVTGTLSITAGDEITQTGAITATSLHLLGGGFATLAEPANNVVNLAAGFSGGDLTYIDADNFLVTVAGGAGGVNIGANDVSLTSMAGTITGLTNINASSTSLTVLAATALTLPQITIDGPQSYTASGITLTGNITSSASGGITFNGPVTLSNDWVVQSTDSNISFLDTVTGANNRLTVNAGTGQIDFGAAVSGMGATTDAAVALTVSADGTGTTFHSTIAANNGLSITGPVVFMDDVTLADGLVGSTFGGEVTLGKVGGMTLSGFDNFSFNGGVLLDSGAATIDSNNSTLIFQGANTLHGPFGLTLNSGTQTITGLDHVGADITSLVVTANTPTIVAGGVMINGPQTYTATGGSSITLQGPVTSTAAGDIIFNGPLLLDNDTIVTAVDSAITFAATVNGAHDLTIASGTGLKSLAGKSATALLSAMGWGRALPCRAPAPPRSVTPSRQAPALSQRGRSRLSAMSRLATAIPDRLSAASSLPATARSAASTISPSARVSRSPTMSACCRTAARSVSAVRFPAPTHSRSMRLRAARAR